MIDALFILCVGTVVVIVMLLEFPGEPRASMAKLSENVQPDGQGGKT